MKLLGNNKDVLPNIVTVDDNMGTIKFSLGFSFLLLFLFSFSFFSFYIFCMLASHNGIVITTRLVALSYLLLLQPLVKRNVHA
jgi:hypothetical protein